MAGSAKPDSSMIEANYSVIDGSPSYNKIGLFDGEITDRSNCYGVITYKEIGWVEIETYEWSIVHRYSCTNFSSNPIADSSNEHIQILKKDNLDNYEDVTKRYIKAGSGEGWLTLTKPLPAGIYKFIGKEITQVYEGEWFIEKSAPGINFLIEDNGTYKTYDSENECLVDFTGDISKIYNTDEDKIFMHDFVNTKVLTPNMKIIANKNFNLIIDSLKSTQEMICTLEPISMKKFETIHSITGDYTIENNGAIKLIFSFDKGATWKTYDVSGSAWKDVNVDIPIRLYENFSDTDKTNWNTARDTILSDGISVQDLGNVDFQSVKTDNLMFAIVFNRPSYADTCTLNKLNINYDGVATYDQLAVGSDLSKYEAKISITGDTIGVTTAKDADKILVAMTTNI